MNIYNEIPQGKLCDYGCGQPAIHRTNGSRDDGPFRGGPIYRCAKSHHACPAIKQKKIQTSLKNYGTEYPWQTEEVMARRDQTNIKKYGNRCSIRSPDVANKRKKTMLERYGVEQPTSNLELRARAAAGVKQSYINDPTLSARQVKRRREIYGEDCQPIVAKCRATRIASGSWLDPSKKTEWLNYKRAVGNLTRRSYKKFAHLINPQNLPTGLCQYQLDHIFSIRKGFELNIAPDVIAHYTNLRMLWHSENKSKSIRCDCTVEELYERIGATEAAPKPM